MTDDSDLLEILENSDYLPHIYPIEEKHKMKYGDIYFIKHGNVAEIPKQKHRNSMLEGYSMMYGDTLALNYNGSFMRMFSWNGESFD